MLAVCCWVKLYFILIYWWEYFKILLFMKRHCVVVVVAVFFFFLPKLGAVPYDYIALQLYLLWLWINLWPC